MGLNSRLTPCSDENVLALSFGHPASHALPLSVCLSLSNKSLHKFLPSSSCGLIVVFPDYLRERRGFVLQHDVTTELSVYHEVSMLCASLCVHGEMKS